MLDVLVPEVVLQRSGVPTRVRLVEAAGVPQHMGVGLYFEPSGLRSPADEFLEVAHGHRRPALAHEHERRSAFGLPVQSTQRAQFPTCQWVSRWRAVLCTGDRQRRSGKINLGPLQVTDLGRPQPVAEGHQDHGLIPVRPPAAFAARDQLLDLAFGQVLAGAHVGVLGAAA